jgi:nitroreductase
MMSTIVPEILSRRAYRAFDPAPVPIEVIDRMLQAATLAPSCANKQSWRFIAVTDSAVLSEVKKQLSEGNYWAKTAPAIIIVATKPEYGCRLSDRRDYALFDCGLASMNLMLQGAREGLSVHPIAGYEPEPVKLAVGLPEDLILVTLLIVGYPGDAAHLSDKHRRQETAPRERKPEREVIAYDRVPAGWI